jgi:cytochrome c peroxidase
MNWKLLSLVVSVLLPLSVAASVADNGSVSGIASLRDQYRRPPEIPYPDDDPYSAAKAKLGRMLFFEPLLSESRTNSCASCHNPSLSWQDGLPLALGDSGHTMSVRTPTLLNVAWLVRLAWDGRFPNLEEFAFSPVVSSANMHMTAPDAINRLAALSGYRRDFAAAFDDGTITRSHIESALATYLRSIVSTEAPFDRWVAGDEDAIDASAKRGFALFNGKGRCAECHSGWAFTDGSFHDIGIAKEDDIGRGRYFPTSVKLRHAFKTPTLRDVARRAPYMHDGSMPTLEAVIDHYNIGGIDRPSRSELIKPLGLTGQEEADLLAFLETLTSKPQPVELPTLPR